MKRSFTIGAAALLCALSAATVSAKNYKLPNGKVLVDPYVISQRPDGLEVGHKSGVLFVKFKNLPKEIQKKYGYDPTKAAAYEKQQTEAKRKFDAKKRAEAARKEQMRREVNQNLFKASVERLEQDIRKTELRIKFLKEEIPRLNKEADKLLDKATNLAGKKVSSGPRRVDYGWDGGYVVTGGRNSRAENTKKRTVKKLGEEYYSVKRKITKYQKELEQKQLSLARMKKNYKIRSAKLKK